MLRPVEIEIGEAATRDADAIAALHAESWRATYRGILPDAFLDGEADRNRRAHWRDRMNAGAAGMLVLKAVNGHELCGFACLFFEADPLWGALLDNLHVAPRWTGYGVGSRLFASSFARLRERSTERPLHLWVFEQNARARRFYDRHGGVCADRAVIEVLPGIHVPELRYVWRGTSTDSPADSPAGISRAQR
jgi:GNAT superfamily N-acetyltransferase